MHTFAISAMVAFCAFPFIESRSEKGNDPLVDAEAAFQRGNSLLLKEEASKDDLEDAIEAFSEAIRLNPKLTKAFYSRGVARGLTEKWASACEDFDVVLSNEPENAQAYKDRGVLRWYLGRKLEGQQDLAKAQELSPTDWQIFYNRGRLWTEESEFDKAIEDYTKALQLATSDKSRFQIHANRGAVQFKKEEWDKAIDDATAALRYKPLDRSELFNRAITWIEKGEWAKAESDFTAILRQGPGATDSLTINSFRERGYVRSALTKWFDAIGDFDATIKLDPGDEEAIHLRAWIRASCPDAKYRDGKLALEEALAVCRISEWKNARHYVVVAAAYAELGQFDKAVAWQKKALEDPIYAKVAGDAGKQYLKLYEGKKPAYAFKKPR